MRRMCVWGRRGASVQWGEGSTLAVGVRASGRAFVRTCESTRVWVCGCVEVWV